jgi:hypothetical protein
MTGSPVPHYLQLMVAIPLSGGYGDPSTVCSRDTIPILVLHVGAEGRDVAVRWRGPRTQLQALADAINRLASASPS